MPDWGRSAHRSQKEQEKVRLLTASLSTFTNIATLQVQKASELK